MLFEQITAAKVGAADEPPQPAEPSLFHAADVGDTVNEILAEMVEDEEAAFRPIAATYQDFTVRCRMRRIPAESLDLMSFRRRFAMALTGFGAGNDRGETIEALLATARTVPDDLLAPFLLIARAAIDGAPCPDDESLARIYGTRSPGRIRRMLEHLEKSGFIVLRTDYGGRRSVGLPGLNLTTAPQDS
jgi:hypothetical protein